MSLRATTPRASRVATLERIEDQRDPPQLLQFDFDASELDEPARSTDGKPRSIKEALIRWLDEQL